MDLCPGMACIFECPLPVLLKADLFHSFLCGEFTRRCTTACMLHNKVHDKLWRGLLHIITTTTVFGWLPQVGAGWLWQEADNLAPEAIEFKVVSIAQPTAQQLEDLKFAWRWVLQTKANCVVDMWKCSCKHRRGQPPSLVQPPPAACAQQSCDLNNPSVPNWINKCVLGKHTPTLRHL